MEQNKENLMELINEFRKWNEEWMANPSIKVRSLKSVDEFAEMCALIAVDEILFALKYNLDGATSGSVKYWQEVKQEIINL